MSTVGTYPAEKKPAGYRQLTVSSTAVGLADATGGIPAFATRAVITVEADAIRWRDDGVDPTSTVGMPAAKDSSFELPSAESIADFKAIRVNTTDVKLNIVYYQS